MVELFNEILYFFVGCFLRHGHRIDLGYLMPMRIPSQLLSAHMFNDASSVSVSQNVDHRTNSVPVQREREGRLY